MQYMSKTIVISANTAWFLLHFERELIINLIQDGYNIHCISKYDKTTFRKLNKLGCTCHKIHINRKGMSPIEETYTLLQYLLLYIKIRPKVILSFTIKPVIYSGIISRILKIKTINTITGLGTAFINEGLQKKIVITLYKSALKKADKVLVLNNYDKKIFIKYKLCNKEILNIIPGAGVDINKFKYSIKPPSSIIDFVFIGRILKDKGILEFIEASKKILLNYENIKVQIVGPIDTDNISAINTEELENLIKDTKIKYLGESADIYPILKQSDCIVLPSYREGVPTVLLEAMATGRPIITTDAPGCTELVINNKNGYKVPIKDPKELSKAMTKIINLSNAERVTMGKLNREIIKQRYTKEMVVNEYKSLLRTLYKNLK